MRRKAITTLAAVLAVAVVVSAVALAAAPKLPLRTKVYATNGYQGGVSVSLVINATDPRVVQPGPAHVFGRFATGGIFVRCPSAPKSSGVVPIAPVAFPSFTLRLSHGRYVFSTSIRSAATLLASTRTSPVALRVLLTGTVVTRRQIKGTVKVLGAPCKRTATYTATLNPALRAEPGQ